MLSAMDRIQELPDDTRIFCGHEYTLKNLEFGMMAEPSNESISKFHKSMSDLITNHGLYSVPGLLSNEKTYNVFMRCREQSI